MLRQSLCFWPSLPSQRLVIRDSQPSSLSSWQRRCCKQPGRQQQQVGSATRGYSSKTLQGAMIVSPVLSSPVLNLIPPLLRSVSQRRYYHLVVVGSSSFQRSLARPRIILLQTSSSTVTTTSATTSTGSVDATTAANTTTTTAAAAKAATASKNNNNSKWWRRLAWFVKYTRIPILIIGIYGLGYQQGIIDYAREPHLLQQGLLLHALSGLGVTSMDQVDILRVSSSKSTRREDDDNEDVQEEHPTRRWILRRRKTSMVVLNRTNTINSLTNRQVAMVGHHMVHAAQLFVRAELAKAQMNVEQQQDQQQQQQQPDATESTASVEKKPPSLSFPIKPKQQQQQKSKQTADANPSQDEDVEFWLQAQRRLEGGDWQYVLVDTPIPNAFVAEILPRRIFVTTGLLESLATRNKDNVGKNRVANGFVSNSDELALVLGHEVSHLILGHVSKRNQVEALLRTLEVLLLSLDPTEGLLSLYIVTILAGIRAAISASYSRDDEREADELGMILCAMAGCDLTKACHVFYKMAQAEGGVEQASVMSSHPPTLERYEFLAEKAKELTEVQQQELQQGKFKRQLLSFR